MTLQGYDAMTSELKFLKGTERPAIIQAIAEAREHGDLSENAEYHAAREQQSFAEGRIQEIESKLSNAQIIDIKKIPQGDKVIFGCTVGLINLDTEERVTYKIVGDDESDVKLNMISYQSPIVRAMIGKEVGDIVVVKTPAGDVEYELDDVRHT